MKHTFSIDNLLLDLSVDSRIESGIFEITNVDHLMILREYLLEGGLNDESVDEVIKNTAVFEGKYPDRQAYNKDGWLVTFPSADYMQAAIKKGTHFKSDPTHGKGGMNLYYKKRGKQKKPEQEPTQVAGQQDQPTTQKQFPQTSTAAPTTTNSVDGSPSSQSQKIPTEPTKTAQSTHATPSSSNGSGSSLPPSTGSDQTSTDGQKTTTTPSQDDAKKSTTQEKPSANVEPVVVQPKVDVTREFAKHKGWISTPYGEWRNQEGQVVAVDSLSGEVAPIKSTDREELKIFSEKRKNG